MKKLKSNKGLTLVELLCCIAILILVSATMVLGVQLGTEQYVKNVTRSQALMLSSSLTTSITDELHYAESVKMTDGSAPAAGATDIVNPAFTGQNKNSWVDESFTVEDNQLKLAVVQKKNDTKTTEIESLYLGMGVYSSGKSKVHIADLDSAASDSNKFWIKYNIASKTFTVNLVIVDKSDNVIVTNQFQVKTLNG